jgi:hypothetical protein
MKTLFVSLVALLFAFFLGCQSSITDPIVSDNGTTLSTPVEENATYKDVISTYPGFLRLTGMLADPINGVNSRAEIGGFVKYKIENLGTDKTSPSHQIRKKISIYVDATLKAGYPNNPVIWAVNGFTNETYPANAALYLFEKSFRVQNALNAPLSLVIKFQFDGSNLSIYSMKLVVARYWVPAGASTL